MKKTLKHNSLEASTKSKTRLCRDSFIQLNAVEINVIEQCNLRCKGCDHAMGIIPKRQISSSDILADVEEAAKIMHTRTVRLIGGEPLLHPELSKILRDVRNTSIADAIELWTNGILLHKIPSIVWQYIDGVVISKYPQQKYDWDISLLREYANTYKLWFHVRNCNNFKWSNQTDRINNLELVKMLHRTCLEARLCHTIRKEKFYKCVQTAFACDRLLANGIKIQDDGIQIHNNPRVREQIESHLWSNNPLNSCYYCLGEFGAYFSHKDLSLNRETGISEPEFDPQLILPDSFI